MQDERPGVTGQCLCGGVRFSGTLKSRDVVVCHCGMCRRWTGGPLMFVDIDGVPSFEGRDLIRVYRSSEKGERGFCTRCGSVLFWKVADEEVYTFTAGALDNTSSLAFTREIFIEEKPHFYVFANDTVKQNGSEAMTGYFAADGKTD